MINETTLDLIGALTGTLAISIAMYIQWVRIESFRQKRVLGLFMVGFVMLVLSMESILWRGESIFLLRVALYASVGAYEYHIVQEMRRRTGEGPIAKIKEEKV